MATPESVKSLQMGMASCLSRLFVNDYELLTASKSKPTLLPPSLSLSFLLSLTLAAYSRLHLQVHGHKGIFPYQVTLLSVDLYENGVVTIKVIH